MCFMCDAMCGVYMCENVHVYGAIGNEWLSNSQQLVCSGPARAAWHNSAYVYGVEKRNSISIPDESWSTDTFVECAQVYTAQYDCW